MSRVSVALAGVLKRRLKIPLPAPFDLLWSYRSREATSLNILRAARAACIWRTATPIDVSIVVFYYLLWLVLFPIQLLIGLWRYGAVTKRAFDRPVIGQISDLLRIAAANNLMPEDYYEGGLARHGGDGNLFRYVPYSLYRESLRLCQKHYARDREAPIRLGNKRTFEEQCVKHAFPCARTTVVAESDGSFSSLYGDFDGSLPARALFIKLERGIWGNGAERWEWHDGVYFQKLTGETLSSRELLDRVSRAARRGRVPMLAQEALANHPALQELAGSTLSTCRIVTIHDRHGTPEVVFAFFRMAADDACPVDNYHRHGILAPLDIATGSLGAGKRRDYGRNPRLFKLTP